METLMKTRFKTALVAAAIAMIPIYAAHAADHQVMMLNKDSEGRVMQFEPAFLKVAVGDTVTFIATDKTHNSESIAKAIPTGATGWKGKINQEVAVTFEVEGFYAHKCLPHVGMGMVGLIQVGEAGAPDPAIAATVPGKGKTRMVELIAQAQGK
jgi:pseudoazurin